MFIFKKLTRAEHTARRATRLEMISVWMDVGLPSSHGAQEPSMPFLADLTMMSGSGSECRTMAPYNPYSAIIVDLPHVFSVLRHLARLFWNHTCNVQRNS